jgi:hypothetical protein
MRGPVHFWPLLCGYGTLREGCRLKVHENRCKERNFCLGEIYVEGNGPMHFLVLVTSGCKEEYVAEENNKSTQSRKVEISCKEIVYKRETETNIK